MANYQIVWKLSTHSAVIQTQGDAVPAGYIKIDEFVHADTEAAITDLEFDVNHVLFHHVRDALYLTGFTDMAIANITIAVTSISAAPATVTLAVAATQQIANTFTPTNASNQVVSYGSSDATKATVSATGLITAVATGSATITVTTADGAKTDTVVVTVA